MGDAAAPTLLRRAGATLAGSTLQQAGLAVAALAFVVTAALGGLEPAGTVVRGVVSLEPGTTLQLGPVQLDVERVRVADEIPGAYPSAEGNRWLAVVATIEATDNRTVSALDLDGVLQLRAVDGLVAPSGETLSAAAAAGVPPHDILVLSDGSSLASAQPGLSYEVAFIWEQDGSATVPTEVDVAAVGSTKRASSLDRQLLWLDARDVAVGTLPVEPVEPVEPA